MGGFKQPTLLYSDAVQDSLVYWGICLGTLPHYLLWLPDMLLVPGWISNKMGTVGVQFPSGAIVVKFEDPEVYCDHHMTGAVF